MATESSNSPQLLVGRHALLADAFELLARHLGPFIDDRMAVYFSGEPSWLDAAANRLGRPSEHGATDPLFQLLVLRRFWGPVFSDFFGQDLRPLIGELIETRNQWAHFNLTSDAGELRSAILAMERLSAPIAPESTGPLRQLRARVENPSAAPETQPTSPTLSVEDEPQTANQFAQQNDPGLTDSNLSERGSVDRGLTDDAGDMPTNDDRVDTQLADSYSIDVAQLEAQLSETESVFAELHQEYDDVVDELSKSRQNAAKKQLRLATLERQLVEIETRAMAAQAVLADERTTRDRIEWLFVGLLAGLLLLMLVLGRW